jgi:beta-N-acetylhexosaminidase
MVLNIFHPGNDDSHNSFRELLGQGRVTCHYSRGVSTGRNRWRARAMAACALVLSGVAVAGCTGGPAAPSPSPSSTAPVSHRPAAASPPATPATDPPQPTAATTASAAAACVDQVYGGMTLAQRVGQLFLVGVSGDVAGPVTAAALRQYHFGSLLLEASTAVGVYGLSAATAHMQSLATQASTDGVRFFVAANQEGGQVQPLTGQGFSEMPTALTQGSWPVSTLRQQAQAWGSELRQAGVNLDLAPVMDVVPPGGAATNAPDGQYEREFGFDPAGNGAHGAAFIEGMAAAGVATTAKHFPGLGRVTGNTDFTSGVVDSVTTPTDPYLGSFRAAVGARVPFVMVALATYTRIDPSRLAAFSPVVMRLLRSGLGFGGVIISDDLGQAAAVAAIPAGQRAIDFLSAGGDMVTSQIMAPAEVMAAAVLARASADTSFRALVDAAVLRVLTAKQAYGLLPC